ncbi:MAG: 50S ribosome-binding GTPase [Marinobacterium sp.]|nr:50S ribosome-binding GTPase [Marinobacterium sp.]
MRAVINSVQLALQLSPGLGTLLLVSLIVPLLTLAALGVWTLWQAGYGLWLLATLSFSAVLTALLFWRAGQQQQGLQAVAGEALVEASTDWGEGDLVIWQQGNQTLEQLLAAKSDWQVLDEHALHLVAEVAQGYGRAELAFSLPELLQLTEEVSRRYRQVLLEHVPLIEQIPCTFYKAGFEHRQLGERSVKTASALWKGYRLYRAANPLAMLLSEVREKILGQAFAGIGDQLQYRLKQALLQDVLAVAIDLYSGRFRPQATQAASATLQADQHRMAPAPEPVRVCLIGQTGSGKSSLVNALLQGSQAEVSALPSTDQTAVYCCQLEGVELLHLVDLPGLDGGEENMQQLLEQVAQSQLVIWLLRADQPARGVDSVFAAQLQTFWQQPEHRSRRQPVMLGVLNQIDRLKPLGVLPALAELEQPVSEKAQIVAQAQSWNRQQLPLLECLIPVSLVDTGKAGQPFNLTALQRQLAVQMERCLQIQFNQRRLEGENGADWQSQLKRLYRLGRAVFSSSERP